MPTGGIGASAAAPPIEKPVLVESEVEGEFETVHFHEPGAGDDDHHHRDSDGHAATGGRGPMEGSSSSAGGGDGRGAQDVEDEGRASGPKAGEGDDPLAELTETASKVANIAKGAAKDVQEAALQLSNRWTSAVNTAVETNSPLAKIVGGISTWWANLDPTAPEGGQPGGSQDSDAAAEMKTAELQKLYGLSENDTLLEQFKCKLLQSYSCSHNSYTPDMQMAFPIDLSITEQHFCFCVEHRGHKYPSVISNMQVSKVEKKYEAGDLVLAVNLNENQTLIFKGFIAENALDSALALLEHLTAR